MYSRSREKQVNSSVNNGNTGGMAASWEGHVVHDIHANISPLFVLKNEVHIDIMEGLSIIEGLRIPSIIHSPGF